MHIVEGKSVKTVTDVGTEIIKKIVPDRVVVMTDENPVSHIDSLMIAALAKEMSK